MTDPTPLAEPAVPPAGNDPDPLAGVEMDPTTLAAAVTRSAMDGPVCTPDPTDVPVRVPAGGSDPTLPQPPDDPAALAALIPRGNSF